MTWGELFDRADSTEVTVAEISAALARQRGEGDGS